jgi:NAD(P)-dependent dehydrogenase (short-subunit alcohol dehydrogenase family)
MIKLIGKTALITGAGRGIGRAVAILFARSGADLIIISRTATELEEAAEKCRSEGVNVFHASLDLGDQRQIDEFFEKINEKFPRINILVNNAARFSAGPVERYSVEELRLMLETNLVAPFYLSQKVIPLMEKSGGGTIVNVSSFSGCFGTEKFPGFGGYNISKYGLWGLTEILALENMKKNIRVNQISLSGADTEMFHRAVPPGVKANLTPEEVAGQILYLASDDSAPLSGENIMLAGMPERE